MKQIIALGLALSLAICGLVSGCRSSEPSLTPEEARRATDSRIKQLGLAVMRYAERNNEMLPDMTSPEALKVAITPYLSEEPVGGEEILVDAGSGESFQPNPFFSKKNIIQTSDPRPIAMLYQSSPSPNMTRAVVFGDGHHERIGENLWPAVKMKSQIP